MTPTQQKQVAECREKIARGHTVQQLRDHPYGEAAIQIAFGRDPENMDPYGPQNHEVR